MSDSDIYKKRYERERKARKEAEQLLEQKSLELYETNLAIAQLNEQLEKQVVDRTSKLKEAKDELEMIAYIASHDLKTPLRSISHVSSWLEEDIQAGDYSEVFNYTSMLKRRVERIETLLNSLIEYTNLNQEILDHREVDVQELVTTIIAYEKEGQNLDWEIKPKLPKMKASKVLLEKVFKNLIHNAIFYNNKEDKSLKIGFEKRLESYLFSVSDNGNGIDPRFSKKIFELFQTLSRKDENDSSGIGLPIAKKIVMSQGGDIWFESEPQVGTTFYFTWKSI
jgi:light-regulated signal transduction histidine kinase (bacteriophytochrome)